MEGLGLLADNDEDQIDQEDSGVEQELDNQDDQEDVKPLLHAPINFDTSVPIVIDSDVDSDCFIEKFEPGTAPTKNIDTVIHLCKYNCYLCLKKPLS